MASHITRVETHRRRFRYSRRLKRHRAWTKWNGEGSTKRLPTNPTTLAPIDPFPPI